MLACAQALIPHALGLLRRFDLSFNRGAIRQKRVLHRPRIDKSGVAEVFCADFEPADEVLYIHYTIDYDLPDDTLLAHQGGRQDHG